MHQAGMDTHGNGHFEGHAWTCPDFSAVDILNPIRLGTAAMRPWLSVYCSNSLAWRRQGNATGDVNADTDDTDHRLIQQEDCSSCRCCYCYQGPHGRRRCLNLRPQVPEEWSKSDAVTVRPDPRLTVHKLISIDDDGNRFCSSPDRWSSFAAMLRFLEVSTNLCGPRKLCRRRMKTTSERKLVVTDCTIIAELLRENHILYVRHFFKICCELSL